MSVEASLATIATSATRTVAIVEGKLVKNRGGKFVGAGLKVIRDRDWDRCFGSSSSSSTLQQHCKSEAEAAATGPYDACCCVANTTG